MLIFRKEAGALVFSSRDVMCLKNVYAEVHRQRLEIILFFSEIRYIIKILSNYSIHTHTHIKIRKLDIRESD